MFRFPVMRSSLCFTDVKIIAVPASDFVNDSKLYRTIQAGGGGGGGRKEKKGKRGLEHRGRGILNNYFRLKVQ